MRELRGVRLAWRLDGWEVFHLLIALLSGAVFVWLLLAVHPAGVARAEPYMSVREGYKCSKCHVNKTGGGMRTDYAKVYMNTRMAMYPGLSRRGEGARVEANLATSRLGEHFSINADLRADAVYTNHVGAEGGWEFNHASTSGDCAGCHDLSSGGGKRAEIYLRAEFEPEFASVVVSQSLSPVNGSREMYAVLDVLPLNGYVKAGTFRLPTGLNNTFDEPFYHINQSSGASVPALETVRGDGVEVGIEPGPFAVSFSITNPGNLTDAPTDKRMVLSGYGVIPLGLAGVTVYRDPISQGDDTTDDEYRDFSGIFLGLNLGRVTALLELDTLSTTVAGETEQEFGLAQLDFLLSRGQNIKLQYEYLDPDTSAEDDTRDRTTLVYEPFLTPYMQMRLGYRKWNGPTQADPTTADPNNVKQIFLELHLMY